MTGVQAQALIDSAGKFLNAGVELKILFEDTTIVSAESLNISGFSGPGVLTIASLTTPAFDTTTARPVTITNSNDPDVSEYTISDVFDNFTIWEALRNNSALFISGCSCSQVGISGFSFNSKTFPVVITSTSSLVYFRGNFCNQINAFTRAEYTGAGFIAYGGNLFIDTNKFTTDTDTDGLNLQGSQVQLQSSAGNGSYLVTGNTGVCIAEPSPTSNDSFTSTINKFIINGFWSDSVTTG